MKKILSLCVCIIVTALCVMYANAATYGGNCGKDGDNVTWEFSPGTDTFTVSGIGKMEDYPVYYEDYGWFEGPALITTTPWNPHSGDIRTVKINEGVTRIGECAFYRYSYLDSIYLPESLTSIGSKAFEDCALLKDIYCYKGSYADRYFSESRYTKHYITDTGDADGDGEISVRDAALILQYRAYWDVEIDTVQADVTGDGKVNARDAARILQYLAGWNVELK